MTHRPTARELLDGPRGRRLCFAVAEALSPGLDRAMNLAAHFDGPVQDVDAALRASEPAAVFSYTATVRDPRGRVVGTTTEEATQGAGTATTTIALPRLTGAGRYTVEVVGDYAASDPDTVDSDSVLGRTVTLHVAQLD